MRRLYGNTLRENSGFTKTIRNVTQKNVSRAPKELQRKIQELSGSLDKVFEETTGAVDSFIGKCEGVVVCIFYLEL